MELVPGSDAAKLLSDLEAASTRFQQGDDSGMRALYADRDDVTLFGALGGCIRGREGDDQATQTEDSDTGVFSSADYDRSEGAVEVWKTLAGGSLDDNQHGLIWGLQDSSNYYEAVASGSGGDGWAIVKVVSGTPTVLDSDSTTWSLGDKIGIRHLADGDIELYRDSGSGWTLVTTVNDTTYTSGRIGMIAHGLNQNESDDFGGGEVAATGGGGGGGEGGEEVTYTYDAVGNRLTQNSTTYTYDDANQLTSAGGVSFGYDANGNQTSKASDTFEWDHENRLTEATIDSTTWSHEYNGDGLRLSRGDGTTTVDYVWDVAGGLPMLLQDGTNTYVYGLGLISIYDGSDMTYRLVDGLGSTVNLCDEDGELIGAYDYDVFGSVREQDGAETEFSFAGEQSDPNGLDFLRARYYDPEIGRFLSGDPLGGGYGYVGNNPVNGVDPSGMVVVCTDWREGLCAGTTTIPDQFAGLYIAADSVEHWVAPAPKKAAPTPPTVVVAAQTPKPTDAVFEAEVQQATQQVSGGFDPGYDAGSVAVASVASDPYSQNEILAANSTCPAGYALSHCMSLRTVVEIHRHGVSECYAHDLECYERLEMGLLGIGTVGLGLGIIQIGCTAGTVLCPVAIISGGVVIGGGLALTYISLMDWPDHH